MVIQNYVDHLIAAVRLIFFFNDTATTEIYTLSLHDALPILLLKVHEPTETLIVTGSREQAALVAETLASLAPPRSEEHTSELQSRQYLVCRLLLEKKKYTDPTLDRLHTLTFIAIDDISKLLF